MLTINVPGVVLKHMPDDKVHVLCDDPMPSTIVAAECDRNVAIGQRVLLEVDAEPQTDSGHPAMLWPVAARVASFVDDEEEENVAQLKYKAIIGRERALLDGLSKALNQTIGHPTPSRRVEAELRRHQVSRVYETNLGNAFEVQVHDPDGQPTGHIARVTIELDRFEAP